MSTLCQASLRHSAHVTLALAAALLSPLAGGCSRDRPDPATTRDSTIVLASRSADEEALLYGAPAQLLFLPLLRSDEHGDIGGALARSWEHSADGRQWTFHLRTDVRWHDGVPVTSRDVKFTSDLLSDTTVGEGGFGAVEAPDDSTAVVSATSPWTAENWTVEAIFPEHLLRGLDRRTFHSWDFWKRPVGDGPYRFVRFLPRTMIELRANPDYYPGLPRIPRVIIRFIGNSGFTELLGGTVDVADGLTAGEAARLARDPRFRLYPWFNEEAIQAIYWRNDEPLFADARVRRALTLAIDRRRLLAVLSLPPSTPIPDAIYTVRQFRGGRLPPPLPYDTVQARRLLSEAGWRDTDGDGVLDRNGHPFRFTLMAPRRYYGVEQAAVFIQDELRRVGIRAEIEPLDVTLARQRMRDGDYDAVLDVLGSGPPLRNLFEEDVFKLGYHNPGMNRLIEEALATADEDRRDSLHAEMTRIFRHDLPFTELFPFATITAAHRRVRGLASPFRTHPEAFMPELWLDDSDSAGGGVP